MMNRELETRYTQMKLTWKNLVNANIDLVDENKYLKEEIERLKDVIKNKHLKEIERLNNIINEIENEINIAIKELQPNELVPGRELITNIKNCLQELKGSDKE